MEGINEEPTIAIIGLGYVGLPLAVEFAKVYSVIGFDINKDRVKELNEANDDTLEVDKEDLEVVIKDTPTKNKGLYITFQPNEIEQANCYIITVPTPTDTLNVPILKPLELSSITVGRYLKRGDVVIYESTVYPGVTEDFCVPILEKESKLTYNSDFFVGYSPERINPGDKTRTITKIMKITSGSTVATADFVDKLYASIIEAGTYLAPSIKVAEAAKVIENSQRDINIAFVNELSKIFRILDIDTKEVLAAAGTKWNFINFYPGLVGGHCIGVDPYYLAHKAIDSGYNPGIILAGRKMNDSMGAYVAQETIRLMVAKGIAIKGAKVLIMGITFKENCPDIRNSKVLDIVRELISYHVTLDIYDPWANSEEVKKEYNLDLISNEQAHNKKYDSIIVAVGHEQFLNNDLERLKADKCVVFDVKGVYPKSHIDARL